MENSQNAIEKEAAYYHITESGVECDLCPHACNLSDNQWGLCHSRVNKRGVLYATSYGTACALHIDPIEKKPLLHYYPDRKSVV